MELIVERHCVAEGTNGLSLLQQALIHDPRRIRVAEAPTGAGKSYAFQRAMRDEGQRILFIVPTRRLAQNLATGLIQELAESNGWSVRRAERCVAVWSSDQTAALNAAGITKINGVRLRQMSALQLGSRDGEMIVAIPEVVSALLVKRRLEAGQAGESVFDLLEDFDHIVFDEFHTIEARGFGLATLFARLATAPRDGAVGYGGAKLSFLSATPLDLAPTLRDVGVPESEIAVLSESVGADGRALHGDVALEIVEADSLYALITERLAEVAAEIDRGNQVVVIYNRLSDLEKDLPSLADALPAVGIEPDRVLVVNSIRDSIPKDLHGGGFAVGHTRNPLEFDLILATASVEMGVTFRNANLMLMEPGFAPMNFLQRHGRAARRGADGRVIVRLDAREVGRRPWLRQLRDWVAKNDGQRVSISSLSEVLTQSVRGAFATDPGHNVFGTLPKRASWCGGLYWRVLMEHPSNRGHRGEHLFRHQPETARTIAALEQTLKRLGETNASVKRDIDHWLKLFRAQAFDLRTIEPKVRVVPDKGMGFDAPRVWLQRETTVFERGTTRDDGVHITGTLDDYWRDERDYDAERQWCCYFPHTAEVRVLPMDAGLVERWCRALESVDPYRFHWDEYPEAREAATRLVKLTGLVPGHDPDISVEAVHAVL